MGPRPNSPRLSYLTWGVVEPLLVTIVLATMLWPWVSKIAGRQFGPRHWRVPRFLAVTLIYLITLLVAVGMILLALSVLTPVVDRLLITYPGETAFLRTYLDPFRKGNIAGGAAKIVGDVAKQSAKATSSAAAQGTSASLPPVNVEALAFGLFGGVVTTVLVLIFTFFLLLEGQGIAEWTLLLIPLDRRAYVRETGLMIRDQTSRWVLATTIYSTTSALIVGTGMGLLGLPSPWLFALGAAILALIPGIGPASVMIPAVIVALQLSQWQAIAVALFGIVLYVLDATFIAPKIFGGVLRLSMFVVFLAILIGGSLLGVWGAILALPIATAGKLVLEQVLYREQLDSV